MKIPVATLKQFKANSSFIKQTNILPILFYLRFKDGKITKNNMASFVIQETGLEGSFLVDENILMNYIDNVSVPEIDITPEKNRIKITDGFTTITSPTDDVNLFPSNDEPDGKTTVLNNDCLQAMFLASKFVLSEEEIPTAKSHVFVGKDHVCGSNAVVGFIEKVGKVPEMVLTKDIVLAISKNQELEYSSNKSYYFFKATGITYGFSKPEYPFFDLTPFGQYKKDAEYLVIPKNDLIAFNNICISSAKSKVLAASMVMEDKLQLSFNDEAYEISINREIETEGKMSGKFMYSPLMMNIVLKNMEGDKLHFYKSENKFHINNQPGCTALLMGINA